MIGLFNKKLVRFEEYIEQHAFAFLVFLCVANYLVIKNLKEVGDWLAFTLPGHIVCGMFLLAMAVWLLPLIYNELKLMWYSVNKITTRKK